LEINDRVNYSYQAFSNVVGKLEFSNDIVDDTYDLLTMTRYMESTIKILKELRYRNLYVLVCSLAMESVTQTK
jgi:hypothetical protein